MAEKKSRPAVCVLVRGEDNKILGVSRKDDHTDWGLPGGKQEPGESQVDCAFRETKEEAGIEVHSLHPFFAGLCQGEACFTFLAEAFSGTPHSSEEGKVEWITWDELTDPSNSFYEYNLELRKHFETIEGASNTLGMSLIDAWSLYWGQKAQKAES